jgi:hypothetical protein
MMKKRQRIVGEVLGQQVDVEEILPVHLARRSEVSATRHNQVVVDQGISKWLVCRIARARTKERIRRRMIDQGGRQRSIAILNSKRGIVQILVKR